MLSDRWATGCERADIGSEKTWIVVGIQRSKIPSHVGLTMLLGVDAMWKDRWARPKNDPYL